jgi:hypothetical protein
VSQGKSDRSEPVDYVLNCERPRSFLIASTHPAFVVGETNNVATENQPTSTAPEKPGRQEQDLLRAERIENPHWEGKQLQVAVGQAIEKEQQMAVPFAVLNSSARTIEVQPPQIQLVGTSKDKHRKAIKAEPVAIKDYWITSRSLVGFSPELTSQKPVFYEQATGVKVCFWFFLSQGFAFTLVGVATHVVLHRVSIRTLGELSASERFRILGVRSLPSAPCEELCPP